MKKNNKTKIDGCIELWKHLKNCKECKKILNRKLKQKEEEMAKDIDYIYRRGHEQCLKDLAEEIEKMKK